MTEPATPLQNALPDIVVRQIECIYGPNGWGRVEITVQRGRVVQYRLIYDVQRKKEQQGPNLER